MSSPSPASSGPPSPGRADSYSLGRLLRTFWRDFVAPHRGAFALVAGLMVLTVLLQLPVPLLTMFIIDTAVETRRLGAIDQLALALVALVILRHVFSYVHETVTLRLKESIILEVQARLFRHLQSLPLGFFTRRHSTYLQSRMMNDSRAIEGALVRTVITVAMNTLTFVVGAVIILFIRYQLGFVLLFSILPFAYVRYFGNQRMRELSKEMQEEQATASAVVSERLAGIGTIKALGQEEAQAQVVSQRLRSLRDVYVRTNWFGIVSSVGTSLITALSVAFVLWYGLHGVVLGEMTLGEVVGVLSLLNFLYTPVNSLVAANLSLQQASSALQRIYEFLGERPERSAGARLEVVEGGIELRDVSFAYGPEGHAFRGFDLSIAPREVLALVGRSGAGKSTLVNLLLRFYEPQGGEILIDGQDIRDVDLKSLRAAIGIVDQQTFLFTATIADNIRLGRPDATPEEVVAAARKAYAHDFIEALPGGYETRVGERGETLSGGECQRIALARMFLRDPKVLILDEAVSAVDSESEAYIQETLRSLARDRTTIIIAHRLSTLLLAQRVVLIDRGVLVEQGTHQELLAAQGAYARLFQQQFQPQVADGGSPAAVSVA